jgi:hypothetical protein
MKHIAYCLLALACSALKSLRPTLPLARPASITPGASVTGEPWLRRGRPMRIQWAWRRDVTYAPACGSAGRSAKAAFAAPTAA